MQPKHIRPGTLESSPTKLEVIAFPKIFCFLDKSLQF